MCTVIGRGQKSLALSFRVSTQLSSSGQLKVMTAYMLLLCHGEGGKVLTPSQVCFSLPNLHNSMPLLPEWI